MTVLNWERCDLQFGFCICIIVYLLMQHKFCGVSPMDRSWRTWKMKQITPTYLRWSPIFNLLLFYYFYFFSWRFIKDLLMQHKVCCINLIGRSWRIKKPNRITSTYLILEARAIHKRMNSVGVGWSSLSVIATPMLQLAFLQRPWPLLWTRP